MTVMLNQTHHHTQDLNNVVHRSERPEPLKNPQPLAQLLERLIRASVTDYLTLHCLWWPHGESMPPASLYLCGSVSHLEKGQKARELLELEITDLCYLTMRIKNWARKMAQRVKVAQATWPEFRPWSPWWTGEDHLRQVALRPLRMHGCWGMLF